MNRIVSLAPGFSPVLADKECENRFNGFSSADKPLKRLAATPRHVTRLKPGANERRKRATHHCDTQ
jgi:hypothetical protein